MEKKVERESIVRSEGKRYNKTNVNKVERECKKRKSRDSKRRKLREKNEKVERDSWGRLMTSWGWQCESKERK